MMQVISLAEQIIVKNISAEIHDEKFSSAFVYLEFSLILFEALV